MPTEADLPAYINFDPEERYLSIWQLWGMKSAIYQHKKCMHFSYCSTSYLEGPILKIRSPKSMSYSVLVSLLQLPIALSFQLDGNWALLWHRSHLKRCKCKHCWLAQGFPVGWGVLCMEFKKFFILLNIAAWAVVHVESFCPSTLWDRDRSV